MQHRVVTFNLLLKVINQTSDKTAKKHKAVSYGRYRQTAWRMFGEFEIEEKNEGGRKIVNGHMSLPFKTHRWNSHDTGKNSDWTQSCVNDMVSTLNKRRSRTAIFSITLVDKKMVEQTIHFYIYAKFEQKRLDRDLVERIRVDCFRE